MAAAYSTQALAQIGAADSARRDTQSGGALREITGTGKVWFVTGSNRGMGAQIAKAALAAGDKVVATARRPDAAREALGTSDNLLITQLDVTQENQAKAAVARAVERFGRIDILVNNAGYGQLGWFEETSQELIERQYATNLFGPMYVTRAALPVMRKQRSGRILTTSSIAGVLAVAGSSTYSGSKYAVEGWMEGLHFEVAPLGIHATIVEPGFFRTDFLDPSSVVYGDISVDDYATLSAEFRKWHDNMNHKQSGDPAKLARALLILAYTDKPPRRFVAGADAVERLEAELLEQRRKEIDGWRQLSSSLDHEV